MTSFGSETDGSDYSKRVDDVYESAKRAAKGKRLLFEMELHTTMMLTNQITVLKVVGGYIYSNTLEKWACFVPDRRLEI